MKKSGRERNAKNAQRKAYAQYVLKDLPLRDIKLAMNAEHVRIVSGKNFTEPRQVAPRVFFTTE
jgi:hypothetical protein